MSKIIVNSVANNGHGAALIRIRTTVVLEKKAFAEKPSRRPVVYGHLCAVELYDFQRTEKERDPNALKANIPDADRSR